MGEVLLVVVTSSCPYCIFGCRVVVTFALSQFSMSCCFYLSQFKSKVYLHSVKMLTHVFSKLLFQPISSAVRLSDDDPHLSPFLDYGL